MNRTTLSKSLAQIKICSRNSAEDREIFQQDATTWPITINADRKNGAVNATATDLCNK